MWQRKITRRSRRARRSRQIVPALAGCLAAAAMAACKGDETASAPAAEPSKAESAAPATAIEPAATPAKAPEASTASEQPPSDREPSPEPPPPVIPQPEDPDWAKDRAEIETRLGKASTPDEINEALSDLAVSINPWAIPAAAKFFGHANAEVAEQAIQTVEQLGTTLSIEHLQTAFSKVRTPELRIRVLEALYYVRSEGDVLPALLVALPDADPRVRKEAAEYVGMLYDTKAIGPLTDRFAAEADPAAKRSLDWALRYLKDETSESPPKQD